MKQPGEKSIMTNSAGTPRTPTIPVLNRWRKLQAIALGAVACLWGTVATAADPFPTKPITEIVPFAAGGPTDVIARITGEHMSKVLGQQIVIENVTGAGGTTGITRGAQAKGDG